MPLSRSFPAAAVAAAALLLPASAFGWAGDVDTTFGTDGRVVTPVGISDSKLTALTTTADGAIAGVGQAWYDADDIRLATARWTSAGALAGSTVLPVPALNPDGGTGSDGLAVTAAPGGIIAGGRTFRVGGQPGRGVLAALTNAGALDPGFSGDGWLVEGFDDTGVRGLTLDGAGRVVAAGAKYGNGYSHIQVRRYTSAGAPDAGFGSGGVVDLPWLSGGPQDSAGHVVPRGATGTVMVVSAGGTDGFQLLALNDAGAPDSTFGTGGRVVTTFPEGASNASDIAAVPGGGFVVSGSVGASGEQWGVARYTEAGQLVGRTVVPGTGYAPQLALDGQGRIVLASRDANANTVVARLLPGGELDTVFGDQGFAIVYDLAGVDVIVNGGRIVVGGTANLNTEGRGDMALAALRSDPPVTPPADDGDEDRATGDATSTTTSSEDASTIPVVARAASVSGVRELRVALRLVSRKVVRGAVRVRLTVPKGTSGRAVLKLRRSNAKGTVLGTKTIRLSKNRSTITISVPLNRAGRAALRSGRVPVAASVVVES